MRDEKNERFPACVPAHTRLGIKIRKAVRQSAVRGMERAARRRPPAGVTPDGDASWAPGEPPKTAPSGAINRSAIWIEEDLVRPEFDLLAKRMEALKEKLRSRGHRFTNTAATFLPRMFYPRSERTKLWENLWTVFHSGVKAGHRALDIGGASTPFSFYLADMGCSVAVVDNDWGNCGTLYNSDHVAKKMGWDLKCWDRDVALRLPFETGSFDRVFSICTIEHLTSDVRRVMMGEVGRVLKPGGIAAITMCYDPNHEVLTVDRGLRFGYRAKFDSDLILPSGLRLYGNRDLLDWRQERGFLGAVFLEKPA